MPVYIFEESGEKRTPRWGDFCADESGCWKIKNMDIPLAARPIYTRRVCKENPMGPIVEMLKQHEDARKNGYFVSMEESLLEAIKKAVKIWREGEGK